MPPPAYAAAAANRNYYSLAPSLVGITLLGGLQGEKNFPTALPIGSRGFEGQHFSEGGGTRLSLPGLVISIIS